MFAEVFNFICNSLTLVFDTMKKFELFEGFTYYNFCIGLFCIPIFIKLIHFIMCIEDEEVNYIHTNNYIKRYDDYIGKHEHYTGYRGKHELDSSYSGKHASYGKHGSRWL